MQKQQQYAAHIQQELIPALESIQQIIQAIREEIAEYRAIHEYIKATHNGQDDKLHNDKGRRTVMTELGAGLWVDAEIVDISSIAMDLGLGLKLELPIGEASSFAEKRIQLLQKRLAIFKAKEQNIQWQIEQFNEAIAETQNALSLSDAALEQNTLQQH